MSSSLALVTVSIVFAAVMGTAARPAVSRTLEIGKGPARAEVSINLSQKLQQMQLNNQ